MTFSPSSLDAAIVFIDASVEDSDRLIHGVYPGIEVVRLASDRDGVEQITTVLQTRSGTSSIHIVSHGSPGCLYLGNTQLSLDTLDRYSADLQQWTRLDDGRGSGRREAPPSLLLYGCNVAAGDAGSEFIQRLHHLTNRPVAASRTLTGSTALGGDWNLEVRTGPVGAIAFTPSTQAQYSAVLVNPDGLQVSSPTGGASWFFSNTAGITGTPASGQFAEDTIPGFAAYIAGLTNKPSGLDYGLMLFVDNQVFAAPTDVTLSADNQTVTAGAVPLGGLNVTVQHYIDPNLPVLRSFITFENTTGADISKPVAWVSNLSSNFSTETKATSSGDAAFTTGDRWVITDNDVDSYPEPANTFVLGGPGTPAVNLSSVSTTVFNDYKDPNFPRPEGILANYQLVVPAGETRSLLFFHGLNDTTAEATTAASRYDNQTTLRSGSLLSGLSATQLKQVANWDFNSEVNLSAVSGNTTEAGGTATFSVVLTQQPTANVTVNLASSNSAEGTVTPSVSFTTANWNQPQTVTITGVDDAIDDGDVAYTITASVTSTDLLYAAATPKTLAVINADNDTTVIPPSNVIKGTRRKDKLRGTAGDDIILGLGGDDTLIGQSGDDRLEGGAGKDKLNGSAGEDLLLGGKGADILTGGAGRDVFGLAAKTGPELITDFKNGQDKLGLIGLKFGQLDIVQSDRNTLIQAKGKTLAILADVQAGQITAADFTSLI